MSVAEDRRDGDMVLAAEYVLRLLPEDERQTFEARLAHEPGLAVQVREWDEIFAPLGNEIFEAAPPPNLKAKIEARLGRTGKRRWSMPRFLYGIVLGAAVGAAAMLVLLVVFPSAPQVGAPAFMAELVAEETELRVTASLDPQSGALSLESAGAPVAAGQDFELWIIPEGETPVSLGVMPAEGALDLVVAAPLLDQLGGAVLAITLEPEGGSPSGAPTGPIVASAPLVQG